MRESTPTVAQVLSLLQLLVSVGGCAVSAPPASKRKGDADQPDEQQHAVEHVPSRARAGASPRRPRSRPAATSSQASPPLQTSPSASGESPTGCRGSAEPRSRPSLRRSGPQCQRRSGARSAAVAAAAHSSLSRTIASDPSPDRGHANDTAQDATAIRLFVDWVSMDMCAAIERPSGRRRCISGSRRGAVFGGRPLACSRCGVTIRLGREQRRSAIATTEASIF